MTERLLRPDDIMETLSCGRDKAIALMRKMRHINISAGASRETLRVTETDFDAWVRENTHRPDPDRPRGRKPTKKAAKPAAARNPHLIAYIHE